MAGNAVATPNREPDLDQRVEAQLEIGGIPLFLIDDLRDVGNFWYEFWPEHQAAHFLNIGVEPHTDASVIELPRESELVSISRADRSDPFGGLAAVVPDGHNHAIWTMAILDKLDRIYQFNPHHSKRIALYRDLAHVETAVQPVMFVHEDLHYLGWRYTNHPNHWNNDPNKVLRNPVPVYLNRKEGLANMQAQGVPIVMNIDLAALYDPGRTYTGIGLHPVSANARKLTTFLQRFSEYRPTLITVNRQGLERTEPEIRDKCGKHVMRALSKVFAPQ